MLVSIFNDVIGPVMRGPSSSHCAASLRIGRMARELIGGTLDEVLVEFDRKGSLPTTHDSQGSDMGLFGGLMGWNADDERLPDSPRALLDGGALNRMVLYVTALIKVKSSMGVIVAAPTAGACAALPGAVMAMADFDPLIPLDEVIETAQRVAGQMPRELRCTALGGLSITPASKAIEQRLADRKVATRGSGACR